MWLHDLIEVICVLIAYVACLHVYVACGQVSGPCHAACACEEPRIRLGQLRLTVHASPGYMSRVLHYTTTPHLRRMCVAISMKLPSIGPSL
jgi:hypothetical protein